MKRFLLLSLVVVMLLSSSCTKREHNLANASVSEPSVVLFVGFDEAARNMDVLCYVAFDPQSNGISFVQIPRDTYYYFGGSQNKINQLYAHYRSTMGESDALLRATSEMSMAFGIKPSGYVALTTNALSEAINALGGVDVELKSDEVFTDEFGNNPLHLHSGVNHLDGAGAVQFIRYRQGYSTGDLGRLDAQKLLFKALLQKIASHPSLDKILNAYLRVKDEIETDIKVFDLLRLNGSVLRHLDSVSVSYLTMPGEAILSQRGISYYSLNRPSATQVCAKYLFSDASAFDKDLKFLKENEIGFRNAYYDKKNSYRVYDNSTVGDITVPKKH